MSAPQTSPTLILALAVLALLAGIAALLMVALLAQSVLM
jgi:hypothetical protein